MANAIACVIQIIYFPELGWIALKAILFEIPKAFQASTVAF